MDSTYSQRLECFSRISLFAWLDTPQVISLAQGAKTGTYEAGDTIFEAGSNSDGIYIIDRGEVTFTSGPPGDIENQQASTLEAGAFFGELSLLGTHEHHASARAALPTTLHHVPRSIFENMECDHPCQYAIVMTNLARSMAKKIRQMNQSRVAVAELHPEG